MLGFLVRNRYLIFAAAAAFIADQVTKLIVIQNVAFRTSWPTTGFFRITHVGNTGSAFGLFDGRNEVLIAASFVGVGILLYFYRQHPAPGLLVSGSLGLMLGGAFGNLTDRLVNGHVTDFIDVGPWWIFNLADASIITGITMVAVSVLLDSRTQPDPEVSPVGGPEAIAEEPTDDDAPSG
jgi:signal peptidase II